MPDTNIDYPLSSAFTRAMRIKLILLCAAGFFLFLSAFKFMSRQYLHHVKEQTNKKYYIALAGNYKLRINNLLDFCNYNNIDQLKLSASNYKKLPSGGGVLYAVLTDLNGFVILHSDSSQEGSRIKIMNKLSESVAKNKDLNINGTVQQVCDVLLPFVRHGNTQGVLRIGYVKKIIKPPISYPEIITREAIKYAYLILYIFIALAIVLIWCVSLFLEHLANKINREQQKTNHRQLEIIGAGIVHEVKNSLNGIRMNIQMLQDQFEKLPSDLRKSFSKKAERIQREAGRTSEMLSEFLTYAKPGRFNPAPTNFPALLNEISQSFEPECKKRRIELTCECSSEMTSIIADSQQLRHGITNLLWNSLEAINEGGKISLKGELSNNKVQISVEDDGGGMNSETRQKSFDVFYSTKLQGAGLGLSIVKKVAISHGGEVMIYNTPGQGCKFTIIFPQGSH